MKRMLVFVILAAAACSDPPRDCYEDVECARPCQVGSCNEEGECVYQHSSAESCQPESPQYVDTRPADDELPPSPFPRRILQPGEVYDRPPRMPPPLPPEPGSPTSPPAPNPIPVPPNPPPCGPQATPSEAAFCD